MSNFIMFAEDLYLNKNNIISIHVKEELISWTYSDDLPPLPNYRFSVQLKMLNNDEYQSKLFKLESDAKSLVILLMEK